MKKNVKNLIKRTITGLLLGALFWISFIYMPVWFFSLVLVAILAQIIVFEWTRLFNPASPLFWLILPFYPVLPFLLIIWMNHSYYRPLLFVMFILVSSHDTGSYIVGNLFGKNQIACMVSPGKTWEGFWGGYLFAIIGLWFALWELNDPKPIFFMLSFTFIVCCSSLLGDLFESWLKRRVNIKDSGAILPGHGGFLDRFDGILFTVFLFYFLRDWLVVYFSSIRC